MSFRVETIYRQLIYQIFPLPAFQAPRFAFGRSVRQRHGEEREMLKGKSRSGQRVAKISPQVSVRWKSKSRSWPVTCYWRGVRDF